VVPERTVREMQGYACIAFEDSPAQKKEIACTRSVGGAITEFEDLVVAVTEFASHTCEKLRKRNGQAGQVLALVHTSAFRVEDKQYSK
jgi:DNA polymerase V